MCVYECFAVVFERVGGGGFDDENVLCFGWGSVGVLGNVDFEGLESRM